MEELQLQSGVLPEDILHDLQLVVSILLRHGARQVILYGSLARGDYHPDSDLDLLADGMAPRQYFAAFAEILLQTDRRVSVLDWRDIKGYFRERLLQEGKVIA